MSGVAIDGICVRCTDLEKTAWFYREVLGFEPDWADGRMIGLRAAYGDGTIGVLLDGDGSPADQVPGSQGVVIGLTVDDVDALVAEVRAVGCGVRLEPSDMGGTRSAAVYDPNGHELWLTGPSKG
jgi:catechol 2,3-dioxygenase-like lactoylglutathione lyase family enzyme